MNMNRTTTTTANPSPAKKREDEQQSRPRTLVPVIIPDDLLKGLSLWETYLRGRLVITPTDSSWRDILMDDKERFWSDAAKYDLNLRQGLS